MSRSSDTSELADFFARYPHKTFKKGEIIIFQGEAPRSAFAVRSGVVKAYNLSVNGDEKPVAFHTDCDIFPGAWTYGKMPSALYYYEAFTPEAEVHVLPREDYMEFIRTRPALLYRELESAVMDQLGTSMRLNALQHSRAGDKLIYTLHYLSLRHGRKLNPQTMEIMLDLTHQDFANLTGLTRETAATELNKLKSSGVITYGKHTPYRIRLDKLMNMLNDQFIADMQVML